MVCLAFWEIIWRPSRELISVISTYARNGKVVDFARAASVPWNFWR